MDKLPLNAQKGRVFKALEGYIRTFLGGEYIKELTVFALSFALGFARLGDKISPFALAFFAAKEKPSFFSFLGASFGYFLAFGRAGLSYVAALFIVFACNTVFRRTKYKDVPYLVPLCAFLSLLCVKCVGAFGEGAGGLIFLLWEGLLCGGLTAIFSFGLIKPVAITPEIIAGRIAIFASLLLVFTPFSLMGGINIARLFASLILMCISLFHGPAVGAGAGLLFGVFMDISTVGGPFFAPIYGVSGLIGGAAGSKKGRFWLAVAHVLANGGAILWAAENPQSVAALFECFIASVVFVILPDSLISRMKEAFLGSSAFAGLNLATGEKTAQSADLTAVVRAMARLEEAAKSSPSAPADVGITRVYNKAADSICKSCPKAHVCWQQDYESTMTALGEATPLLIRRNRLESGDFPAYFSGRCSDISAFADAVNSEYRGHLRQQAELRRQEQTHTLLESSWRGMKELIENTALAANPLLHHEAKAKSVARVYTRARNVEVFAKGGRIFIDVDLVGDTVTDIDAFEKSLALALNTELETPVFIPGVNGSTLRFCQKMGYRVDLASYGRRKDGQPVCGDSMAGFQTADGRQIVMISDGMGTGSGAASASAGAVELLAEFINSGAPLEQSVNALLPFLHSRFQTTGFATLDLLEINLYSGKTTLIKYGAPPSFVVLGGKVSRINGNSLPPGLIPTGWRAKPFETVLGKGDLVIMMSDGLFECGDFEGIIKKNQHQTPSEIAQLLARCAQKDGTNDDISLAVSKIMPQKEEAFLREA